MMPPLKRRSGFTLVEVTLACMLTAFLGILLSTTWTLLMRPTADLIAWGQLFQEMDIAVASLARDVGGGQLDYDDDGSGCLGEKRQGRLLACSGTVTDVNGNHLQLCFDGGTSPNNSADWGAPDTVIDYYVDSGTKTLIRWNQTTGALFTVAKNVDSMTLDNTNSTYIKITLTFAFYFPHPASESPDYWKKHLTRTCVLHVRKSP